MNNYNRRYIARLVLEADTPLFVGSGTEGLLVDMLVQKDHFGLPMILGTSLTGVLRHALEKSGKVTIDAVNDLFGCLKATNSEGKGSRIMVSSAYLMLDDDHCVQAADIPGEFVKEIFLRLPTRNHVRITDRGSAADHGLFNNEVVYKGSRFCFEIELIGNCKDEDTWKHVLAMLTSAGFRLGMGTRHGYGKIHVHKILSRIFDLQSHEDFDDYLQLSSNLNQNSELLHETICDRRGPAGYDEYILKLKPDNFFLFSSGQGDHEVDNIPTKEHTVEYDPVLSLSESPSTVIPGSSIKGAISHRVAYHYNRLQARYASLLSADDRVNDTQKQMLTGAYNEAVSTLFGYTAEDSNQENSQRGLVMVDDVFIPAKNTTEKVFNHVAIDRFTGGALDGALFSEKASRLSDNSEITLSVVVEEAEFENKDMILRALKYSLLDICHGLLPLGGQVAKGHGMFTGTLLLNGNKIETYG